ncbi:MAG: hypothetical protein ABI999_09235 [Acidobacteriota bacterium]
MSVITGEKSRSRLSISSSTLDDVWHADMTPGAYEWWYFDAMSEDGDEAVVVWFLDNSVLSPRYNRSRRPGQPAVERFPAVLFAYYCDGKVVYRAFSEFAGSEIDADTALPACRIGESSFRFDSAPYGSGFEIQIRASLSRGRMLEAKFEWLSVEADLDPTSAVKVGEHSWNVVATRSDVSGRINILNRRGNSIDVRHFRGTGYHDHEHDARGFADTISEKSWGRVHFADTTAVYQVFSEVGRDAEAKLLVTRDGRLIERTVRVDEQNFARDKFGIRYPTRLTLTSDDNIRLRVKPSTILDSSFCSVRFASEMTLTLRDGKPRRSTGISEMIAPRTLKYRWLDWLTDMRIGKNGKGSLL